MVKTGAVISASEIDFGTYAHVADGKTDTIIRSAAVNPAYVQYEFSKQQTVDKLKVFLGQPRFSGDVNSWWVQAADNMEDLLAQKGSFETVVAERRGVTGDWEKYILTEMQNYDEEGVQPGYAQVGTAHYPPNSPRGSNYARGFKNFVKSYADDWYDYPRMTGKYRFVNCDEWNGAQRNYMIWWLSHIPRYAGEHDGILNNWWPCIIDINHY